MLKIFAIALLIVLLGLTYAWSHRQQHTPPGPSLTRETTSDKTPSATKPNAETDAIHSSEPAEARPIATRVHRVGPERVYPDPHRTPGAIDDTVTQTNISSTVCIPGYTRTVRPPSRYTSALKHKQMRAWGLPGNPREYEEDHLIPLELGGCAACQSNLWPEHRVPAPGAREKDIVENYLHGQVCSGSMTLDDARRAIVQDWFAIYRQIQPESTPVKDR